MKPKFSFEYLQPDYCISRCERDDKAALADSIRKFSSITWSEIIRADRHKLGCETIAKGAIKVSLPKCVTDDCTLIALRFSGMKPMVGFRTHEVFFVLWLDRNFTLYAH